MRQVAARRRRFLFCCPNEVAFSIVLLPGMIAVAIGWLRYAVRSIAVG
jgi:hypothetical protein